MRDRIFEGKTIAATGKMKNYTRSEIKNKINSLGATARNTVSRKTDFLIVGDKAGSKLERAKKYGVTILSEQEFEHLTA